MSSVIQFDDADHEALAKALLGARCKWLLSYNDDPWIEALYRQPLVGHGRVHVDRVSAVYTIAATSPQPTRELLIRNYELEPGKR